MRNLRSDEPRNHEWPRRALVALALTAVLGGASSAGCGDDAQSASPSGYGNGSASGGTQHHTNHDMVCGGPEYLTCKEGYYCGDGSCGYPRDVADCLPVPVMECETGGRPVCACRQDVFENACKALVAGRGRCFDIGRCVLGSEDSQICEPPDGWFECGSVFCERGLEFCENVECPDEKWETFACKPIPTECGPTPTCDCLNMPDHTCSVTAERDVKMILRDGCTAG